MCLRTDSQVQGLQQNWTKSRQCPTPKKNTHSLNPMACNLLFALAASFRMKTRQRRTHLHIDLHCFHRTSAKTAELRITEASIISLCQWWKGMGQWASCKISKCKFGCVHMHLYALLYLCTSLLEVLSVMQTQTNVNHESVHRWSGCSG